jgi:hypothetical protein
LAATENANVCTSVRSRYFTVEAIAPERNFIPAEVCGAMGAGGLDLGLDTGNIFNHIKCLHRVREPGGAAPFNAENTPQDLAERFPRKLKNFFSCQKTCS